MVRRFGGSWAFATPGGQGSSAAWLACFELPAFEGRAVELMKRVEATGWKTSTPRKAFRARLDLGEAMARFTSAMPELPGALVRDFPALRRVQIRFAAVDRALAVRSRPFVESILAPRGSRSRIAS
jgi:hypothetical protein